MDRQARKLTSGGKEGENGSENGSELGSNTDSESEEKVRNLFYNIHSCVSFNNNNACRLSRFIPEKQKKKQNKTNTVGLCWSIGPDILFVRSKSSLYYYLTKFTLFEYLGRSFDIFFCIRGRIFYVYKMYPHVNDRQDKIKKEKKYIYILYSIYINKFCGGQFKKF